MITGKLNGHDFIFMDNDVSCLDGETRRLIKNYWRFIITGFQPQDGDPELYLLDYIKISGGKDIKYTPEIEAPDVVY